MENKVDQEENGLHPDQELGKHEATDTEIPETQAPEVENDNKKENTADPFGKLQDDLAEAKEKYIRLYAEFENHRRRTAKEKLEMIQSANERLIVDLLPVIDDFERGEKTMQDKKEADLEGFSLIQNKLKKILEQYGVKPMEAQGKSFDPDFHEAITQIAAPDESQKGKVVDVVEKGYLLNEKVIRYAKVVVGN